MRGELISASIEGAGRVASRVDEAMIERCREERVKLMAPARRLHPGRCAHVRRHTVLVSGGIYCFAEPVVAEIGFIKVVANVLGYYGRRTCRYGAVPDC